MHTPSSLLLRLADAAILGQRYDGSSLSQMVKRLRRGDTQSKLDRISLLMATVLRCLPAGAMLPRRLQRVARLPWVASTPEVIAHGTVSTVYRFRRQDRLLVLKTYRHCLGKSLDEQLRILDVLRREHDLAARWYNRKYAIVVPTLYLVVHGPPLGVPVAAALQPYVEGRTQDLLRDFTDKELTSLFDRHLELREQFLDFAEATIEHFHHGELCHDFLGRNNVILVTRSDEVSLRIIDTEAFELDELSRVPARYEALRRQMARLERLVAHLGPRSTDVPAAV